MGRERERNDRRGEMGKKTVRLWKREHRNERKRPIKRQGRNRKRGRERTSFLTLYTCRLCVSLFRCFSFSVSAVALSFFTSFLCLLSAVFVSLYLYLFFRRSPISVPVAVYISFGACAVQNVGACCLLLKVEL